jgi:hypothetical protein
MDLDHEIIGRDGINMANHDKIYFQSQAAVSAGQLKIIVNFDYKDLSLRGLSLNTDKKIPVDIPCECHVRMQLKGLASDFSLEVKGRIVKQTVGGIKILFNDIDADAYFHLKSLLMFNLFDPNESVHP